MNNNDLLVSEFQRLISYLKEETDNFRSQKNTNYNLLGRKSF